MKKIISFCFIVFTTITIISFTNKSSSPDISDLTLANIEALANGESSGGRITCYKKLKGNQGAPMEDKTWCDDCKARPASEWSQASECS